MESQLASLRRLLRININWLTVVLLGKELVSKEDLEELKKYGKLSLGDEVSFIEKAFSLGRLSSLLKKADYKDITLDKLSRFEKKKYSSIDRLAIREAKLHANRFIQSIAEEVTAEATSRVNKAANDLVSDVMATLKDEVAIAVVEKKTSKELASSLSNVFNNGFKKDWTKFATTELHRAKVRGAAMAIANKIDIYSKSDGIDSKVSVVPDRAACGDCLSLYLDDNGNPKIFRLKDLVASGTNAYTEVKHTRNAQGLHSNWKAVMPPAHPNCYCSLVYVPPGMEWENGKLKVVDDARYKAHLSKAVDTGSLSPTITPPGPESNQATVKIPKPGSIKGLAAPGNKPGPGIGGAVEGFEPCPFGGGADCVAHGGNGAKTHKTGGAVAQAHLAYNKNDPGAAQQEVSPENLAAELMSIRDWKVEEHTYDEVMQHLESGEIIHSKPLSHPGINYGSLKVDIKGNGSALLKPTLIPFDVNHEVSAHRMFNHFGSDRCPTTSSRDHDGKVSSMHAWLPGHTSAGVLGAMQGVRFKDNDGYLIKGFMENTPDKEKLKNQFSEITVMDLLINNADRHNNNFMLDDDFADPRAIDHGFSFGPGFKSYRNTIHGGFKSNNMHIKIPEGMKKKFDNTTLSDINRSVGDQVPDWAVAHTYLRMKYMLKIHEEHGHLPYDEFATESSEDNRKGSNDKFDDYVIDYIDKHSSDINSPEYASAQYFRDLGVFMPTSHSWRGMGANFEHEKFVRTMKALEEAKRDGKEDFTKDKVKAKQDPIIAKYRKEKEQLTKAVVDTEKNYADLYLKHEKSVNDVNTAIRSMLDRNIPLEVAQKEHRKIKAIEKDLNEQLYKAKLEATKASKNLDGLNHEEELELHRAKQSAFMEVVPPGHEKTFKRLNDAIAKLRKREYVTPRISDYVNPSSKKETSKASDIEASKRGITNG
jgi:hypothetical protein